MLQTGVEYYNNNYGIIGNEANRQIQGALLYPETNADTLDNNIAVYFDVIESHSVEINDNITDNWLENSTVVNDCITQSPIIITLSGVSGELVYTPSTNKGWLSGLYSAINDKLLADNNYVLTNKLSTIPALYPPVDNITQMAKNVITTVENNVKRYQKIIENLFKSKEELNQTRLKGIYENLKSLRDSSKVSGDGLIVETPYGTFKDMFIQSIKLTQGNVDHITDISVSLKQIRFSDVENTEADKEVLAELNATAREQEENHGKVQGKNSQMYESIGNNLPYVNY